jgi:hypothetical protein
MGCLFSKYEETLLEETLELDPNSHLYTPYRVNPIYYNQRCVDENGIVYI